MPTPTATSSIAYLDERFLTDLAKSGGQGLFTRLHHALGEIPVSIGAQQEKEPIHRAAPHHDDSRGKAMLSSQIIGVLPARCHGTGC